MKNRGNELFQFVGGLAMLVVGLFILSQKVIVSSGFFGTGIWLGNFHMSNGLIMIPFIIGIVWMFASGGGFWSKVFTVLSVLLIIAAIILSTRIYLTHLTLYEWILILVMIFGGAGLVARVLFAMPGKNRREKEEDQKVIEARDKMREIEKEIEQIKKAPNAYKIIFKDWNMPAYTVQIKMRVVCMSENKKPWNEKMKLVLNELEDKIGAENAAGARNRRVHRTNKTYRTHKQKYATKAEWKKAAFKQEVLLHIVMSAAFLLTTVALLQGIVKVLPESITVSSSVNGRELPIYCVETDKKQIALSFDAAWGDAQLR